MSVDIGEMTQSTFEHIDADGDGRISFEEFISAAVDKLALLTEENLQYAFDKIDTDHDGKVTAQEIANTFI